MVDDAQERWLLPMLARIRTRPGMYLCDERVESLDRYLAGYSQAREDVGQAWMASADEAVWRGFEAWLVTRADGGVPPPSLQYWPSWARAVIQIDAGPSNVLTFFRLFEEYLNSIGESFSKVTPMTYRGSPRPG
jgi:hypothetical protein